MIEKIVSGGQTGVDRAALDAAISSNFPYGGWCPNGRLDENGEMPSIYNLQETPSSDFDERTKWNIRDSDGTLIFVPMLPLSVTDGTVLTIQHVKDVNKPYYIYDLSKPENPNVILEWADHNNVKTLNVAGPRESLSPGIYKQCYPILENIIRLELSFSSKKKNGGPG